jgi:mRNA interferase MazF
VIIQDDAFDATASITVVPLTTVVVGSPSRVPVPATETSGIGHDSFAMADKVTTIRRDQTGARLGRLATATLLELERALMVFLGLAR